MQTLFYLMLSRFKYPQSIWAKHIIAWLKQNHVANTNMVDAPCGNGLMGYLMAQTFKDSNVLLLDIQPSLSDSPYVNAQNLKPQVADLHTVSIPQSDVWLMINSLYCLDHATTILQQHSKSFKTIVFVLPLIERFNYKYFMKKNPGFTNPSVMSKEQLKAVMSEQGFSTCYTSEMVKLPNHFFQRLFEAVRLPIAIQNRLMYGLDHLLFFLPNQYEWIIFKADA